MPFQLHSDKYHNRMSLSFYRSIKISVILYLWITELDFIQYRRSISRQEINGKEGIIQVTKEGSAQSAKIGEHVVVANSVTGQLPDMLLGI